MAQYFLDLVYSLTSCMSCFPSSPNLTINSRTFKILSLLGEGGFSYVYLVRATDGALYALKKIRCPFGQESVSVAVQEAEAYEKPPSPSSDRILKVRELMVRFGLLGKDRKSVV